MIFESPDGGKTVFARHPYNKDRFAISQQNVANQELHLLWTRWLDILEFSKNNPELKELLERAQVIYELYRHDKI